MRACLRETLATNRKQLADQKREQAKIDIENGNSPSKYAKKVNRVQESLILTDLMTKISIFEFYLGKIEAYLRIKHESGIKEDSPLSMKSS